MLAVLICILPNMLFPLDLVANSASVVALALLFWVQYRDQAKIAFIGSNLASPLMVGAVALITVYAGVALVFGLPLGYFTGMIVSPLIGILTWQVASVIILLSVAGELLFRQYLLGLFPYEKSTTWKWAAVILTSALIAADRMWSGDGNLFDPTLIFTESCILATARIASGGVLVPIFLKLFVVLSIGLLAFARALYFAL